MTISPDREDFFTIFNILGRLVLGLSVLMFVPLVTAVAMKEYSALVDFVIGISLSADVGLALIILFPLAKEIRWVHTFFVVSIGWLVASFLGAVPLSLSGHYAGFLDSWFEAMSGFATTGLTLVQDLDHLAASHNMWRHFMMFLGGQGIILASLSLLAQAKGAVMGFYMSEARAEKIMPNIIGTARFIWKVSVVYMVLGVIVLTGVLYAHGLSRGRAFLHGVWLFFASFDTGGFAPQAQNIAYYHSSAVEVVTLVLMMLGAMNFNLHFWLWFKSKREVFKNFEIKIFLSSLAVIALMLFFSLRDLASFAVFRKGLYQLISAHTGCGFTNLAAGELNSFPSLGLVAVIFAMMIGGGVCSTTGGIKLMRLGIIFKSFFMEIKRWMMPHKAVYKETYHHLQEIVLDDKKIKEAFVFFSLFLFIYLLGAIIGMVYGYPGLASLFESVSAAANVGLSLGITSPAMPAPLKVTYIIQMWMGRLEFISIFVSIGFIISLFKK